MATEPVTWRPDWAVAPGEILQELLEERGINQSELARRMGRPIKTINEIVNAKTAVTPETAIQLEMTLGITASFWNNLESTYREYIAREQTHQELEASASWLDKFPIKDLVSNKLIVRGRSKGETLAALLSFFGVGSPSAWESQWIAPAASFRASPAFASSPPAVAAWLRWGELIASRIETKPFDRKRLREVVVEIRRLTRMADFMQTVSRVQDHLASAGVVLVLTPEFTGIHLSGAVHWMSTEKVIIQLSMRYKSNDQFWFSLFHEVGHLQARRRADSVDGDDVADNSTMEAELLADSFARDALIPPDAYSEFINRGDFSAKAIRALAKEQEIAPAIVVGRLQRESHLAKSHLNDLKKKLEWSK